MFEGIGNDNRTSRRYFSAALIVFLASFVLMASSKWTNNLFYAFIALPGLVFLVKERGAGLLSDKLGLAWLVFLLWFLVPAAIAGDGQFYKHIVYVTLFVFVVAGLVNHEFLRSWVFARALFWVICLYIYGYALYAYATGLYAVGQRVDLLPARMENVIYVSIWLLCALALVMPHWLRRQRWVEAFAAVVLSLVAVSFVLQTRTAMVGAAFLFAAWAAWALWRFPRIAGAWLLVFAVLGGVVLWLIKDAGWVHSVIARGDSFRGELFRVMVGEWQNCGWALGCGVEFHTDKLLAGTMPIQHPHNIFVALGLYTGGVSLVLFLVIVAMTLVQAVRLRDPWGMYLACALVMLNFDGSKLIGNPDELWPLVLLPAAMVLGRGLQQRCSIG
ncbi:O-antigen ligase domain-containing protein [Pseudomonas carassii]|uniref:O-antigen ligase domain-containing protein n=1 Tax=Pseudomonas carassii TaxID=3115855 RepID=A0ABU7HGS5_9PSED|nr:O-antigen ligase domain-containing protein [Pseudomonas sp. 137P]MEE1890527.1 O-antigen ligase domain-containing protein [Pseudomonas sp. 137P]